MLRGGNWRHAWHLRHHSAPLLLSLSEQIGLPLSLLTSRESRHVVVAHNITTERRRAFQRRTHYLERFDRVIVLSRGQEKYLRETVGLPAERVRFVFDKVDHQFFMPAAQGPGTGYVLAVGREQRDYATLMAATASVGVPAVIVPSSLWNPADESVRGGVPSNITVRQGLPFVELRKLYEEASVVAVPLRPGVDYAAGVNAVMEGMAMRKALIVSATPGLEGYVDEGVTGRLVPAGDPSALAAAIKELLDDPREAARLGRNARSTVESGRNLDGYVAAIADTAREVMSA